MNKKTVYILDSYGLIYRCYFAFISHPLTNPAGENVSAIYGFFRNFLNFYKKNSPQYLACAMDSKTATFRHQMFPEYKITRDKTPDDLHAQIEIIEEILEALGIKAVRKNGFEADDVIATLVNRGKDENFQVAVLSADKDLLQLVKDGECFVMKPDKSDGWRTMNCADVKANWAVESHQILDFLSLIGDKADNVPGVAGVGEKTAAKLLNEFGTLENLYENTEKLTGALGRKISEGKDAAFFSKKLIELCRDVPLTEQPTDFYIPQPNFGAASRLLEKYGIPSLAGEFRRMASTDDGAVGEVAKKSAVKIRESIIAGGEELRNVAKIVNEKKTVALVFTPDNSGVGLSVDGKSAFFLPFSAEETLWSDNKSKVSSTEVGEFFREIFSQKEISILTDDGKSLWKFLIKNKFSPISAQIRDQVIAFWLLNSHRESFSMKFIGGEMSPHFENFDFDPENFQFDKDGQNHQTVAANQAGFLILLDDYLMKKLEKKELQKLYFSMELPLIPILAEMELEGIRIEKEILQAQGETLKKRIDEIQKEIFFEVGHDFNIASPKQLQTVLFEERKLPVIKKVKTGYSTDNSVLEQLSEMDTVPQRILEFRSCTKLLSTYVDALPKSADKNGRIHTTFVQTGTATGRLSSRDPNLQNIPVREAEGRAIRSAFVTEKGKTLISADYSQIELVLLAHLSGDKELSAAFNSGKDVHRATAALIFALDEEQVTLEMRRVAKTINFGVMYGMSAFRLSKELKIPRNQADIFIKSYFDTYSGVRDFIQGTVEEAEKTGKVQTIFGRTRLIPTILSKNKNEKSAADRIAVNTPIQGSAADIVKIAMIRLKNRLKDTHCKMLLQVHDELIFECEKERADEYAKIIKEEMENVISLSVPLKVSVETGDNWGNFH